MRALLFLAGLLAVAGVAAASAPDGSAGALKHTVTGSVNRKMLGEAAPQQLTAPTNQAMPAASEPEQPGTAQPETSQQPAGPDSTSSAPVNPITEGGASQAPGAAVATPQSADAQPASADQWGGGWGGGWQDWRYDSWRNRGRWRPPGDSAWGWPGDSDWGNWLKTQRQAVPGDAAAAQAVTGADLAAVAVGGAPEAVVSQQAEAEPAAAGSSP